MQTDQLRQKEFIASLFPQDNQQPNPDPDFFQSFQNTQNISEPLPSSNEQQNFPIQNNGSSSLLWEQQLKIQQLQQLHQLQQQIFQQQVCRRRASKSYLHEDFTDGNTERDPTSRAIRPDAQPQPD